MSSPNARTRESYRKRGMLCEIVERYSPFPAPFGKKHDLFGIFDLLAFGPNGKVVGVQATSNSNLADRIEKIRRSPFYPRWMSLGNEIHAVGWAKRGGKGMRKTWQEKVVEMTLASHPPLLSDPLAAGPEEEVDREGRPRWL